MSFSSRVSGTVRVSEVNAPVVHVEGPLLRAAVVPKAGAEVASLQVLLRGNWVETLHRPLDYSAPPNEWRGHAPFQWPAVGRNCVPEELESKTSSQELMMGSWRFEGKRYPMPILGFAQYMDFTIADMDASDDSAWVECQARSSDYSRQYYPFEFHLTCQHIVRSNSLRSLVTVRNLEPSRQMPFSIGNHITFHLPFCEEGSFEECILISPTTHHLELNKQDLLSGRKLPKDLRAGATLADGELWNMVLAGFARANAVVELHDPRSFGFRISQVEVPDDGPRMSQEHIHFVLYAEPQFQSFCPEPWYGEPNSLNTGRALITLEPGEQFTWEMRVQPLLQPG